MVTVSDLVRFATIGDPLALNDDDSAGKASIFSPDHRQVAVVVRGGDLDKGTNGGSLLVYRTADLLDGAKPMSVTAFASATNAQPLAFVKWLADNETIVFAGSRGEAVTQVYRINVRTGKLDQLTHETSQISGYDIDPAGRKLIVSVVAASYPAASDPECRRTGCRVDASSLWDLDTGTYEGSNTLMVRDLHSGTIKALDNPEAKLATIKMCFDPQVSGGGISPDGRFVLRLCEHKAQVLPWWNGYSASPHLRACAKLWDRGCARQFMLFDLESGAVSWLSNAPAVYQQSDPVWIDGGRFLVLVGAVEPLVNVDAAEHARRAESLAVLLFDPRTNKTIRIARLDPRTANVTNTVWDEATQSLTVETRDENRTPLPTMRYRRAGNHWIARVVAASEAPTTIAAGVGLAIEQSLNDRPLLVVVNGQTGEKRTVLDPNPWLAERQLGKVEIIRWTNRDGKAWEGGLYYPPGYRTGVRYPLLIQTHGFDKSKFSMDGLSRNYAGRALAAQGVLVLQVNEKFLDVASTPAEYVTVQAGWEAAIDHLDTLGLIDRNRVGIQGWSRTGPQMGYALTHSAYRFAAGAFTETADFGWYWYMNAGAPDGPDALYGGAPFGGDIKGWLENAPTFNLDRVRTPMLMWGGNASSALWDWYAGLRKLKKPIELWDTPDAAHDAFQVGHRLLVNQLLVDWFVFWLKDEERTAVVPWNGETAASLAEQYARWRVLRKQQDEVLKTPRPPLLKWTPTPVGGGG